MKDKPIQTMAEIIGPITESLERALQQRVQTRKAIEAAHSKTEQTCPVHRTQQLIDMDMSVHETLRTGQMQVIWVACGECAIEKELERAGVPKNLLHCNLTNFDPKTDKQRTALRVATEYATMKTGFLIIAGEQYGVGKSHLAVAIMRAKPQAGRFITQAEFLTKLRQTYRREDAEDIVTNCKRVPLLVLDDIGLSVGGRDEMPTLHEVLNHRYGNKMRTILTTNLQDIQLKETLGARMIDRLKESVFSFLHIDGVSQRRDQKDNYLARGTVND